MIRKALPEDLEELCSMLQRFVSETDLPLTFDLEIARETTWHHIHSEDSILLVYDEGVLAGAVLGVIGRDFYMEKLAYLLQFYVEREFRGLGVSRDLLEAFNNEASKRGAKLIFASATAGMGERGEKMGTRLFERYGYKALGRIFFKGL